MANEEELWVRDSFFESPHDNSKADEAKKSYHVP